MFPYIPFRPVWLKKKPHPQFCIFCPFLFLHRSPFLFLTLLSFTHLSNGTEIQKGKAFWILCSSCKERRWLCEPLYLGVWHPWKGRGMLLSLSNILPFHNICASPLTPPLYPYTYVFPLLTMTDYIRRPYSTFSLEIPR